MTRAEHLSLYLSANDLFKRQYVRALRWSVLVAVILLSVLWMMMPRYEPAPYTLRPTFEPIIDIDVEPLVLPEPKVLPPPPVPRVIEPVEGPGEDPDKIFPVEPWDPWQPAPPPPPPPGTGFVASSANPRLVFQAKPDYPQVARMSGLEGTVIVAVLVGPDGRVENAQIRQGVHPLLDKAALKAAFKCRFEPGRQRSIPVRAWMSVPYRFRLH